MSSEDEQVRRLILTAEEVEVLVVGGVVVRDGVAVALPGTHYLQMEAAIKDGKSTPRMAMPWDVDPDGWEEVLESAKKAIEGEL